MSDNREIKASNEMTVDFSCLFAGVVSVSNHKGEIIKVHMLHPRKQGGNKMCGKTEYANARGQGI